MVSTGFLYPFLLLYLQNALAAMGRSPGTPSPTGSTREPDGPWGGSLAFQKELLGPQSSFGARLAEHPLTVAKRASHHLTGLAGAEPASLSLPRAGNSSLLAFRRLNDVPGTGWK